jgi:hypothetical protein
MRLRWTIGLPHMTLTPQYKKHLRKKGDNGVEER